MLLAGGLLGASPAGGADKVRVKLGIPDEQQLSVARLEFKATGEGKPRLKFKAANEDELSDQIVAVAQGARAKNNKRAVGMVGIGNTPSGATARAAGSADQAGALGIDQLVLDVRARDHRLRLSKAPDTRQFLSVYGTDSQHDRSKSADTFGISQDQFHLNSLGGFVLKFPGLKLTGDPETLAGDRLLDDADVPPGELVASSVAGALGPPGTLHANVVNLVTGEPIPFLLDSSAGPSPDPNVTFFDATYSTPIFGGQVSPTGEDGIVFNADARCATGDGRFGTVIGVPGPRGGTSLLCDHFDPPDDRIFFDIPTTQPPASGERFAIFNPFMGDAVNVPMDSRYTEAVFGDGVTAGIFIP